MSAVVLEDYIKPVLKDGLTEKASARIMRGTVLVTGLLSVATAYAVEHMGQVLQLSMSIPPICTGSLFGVFAIGMFMPWIGKKASFYGALIGATVMIYIVIRARLDMVAGLIRFETKTTSVEGCTYNFTMTQQSPAAALSPDVSETSFHHISYMYYLPLGAVITCISAFILSFFFGFEDPSKVDPRLLAPVVKKFIKSRTNENAPAELKDVHC